MGRGSDFHSCLMWESAFDSTNKRYMIIMPQTVFVPLQLHKITVLFIKVRVVLWLALNYQLGVYQAVYSTVIYFDVWIVLKSPPCFTYINQIKMQAPFSTVMSWHLHCSAFNEAKGAATLTLENIHIRSIFDPVSTKEENKNEDARFSVKIYLNYHNNIICKPPQPHRVPSLFFWVRKSRWTTRPISTPSPLQERVRDPFTAHKSAKKTILISTAPLTRDTFTVSRLSYILFSDDIDMHLILLFLRKQWTFFSRHVCFSEYLPLWKTRHGSTMQVVFPTPHWAEVHWMSLL